MSTIAAFLTLLSICSAPSYGADVETFGTGEVDPSVLQVGDHVEVTFRNIDPLSRSRLAEAVGMVVEVTPKFFVVEDPEDEEVIEYEAVIRLDRTRSDAWTLDPLDLAVPQGVLIQKYLEGRELTGLEGTWVWDDASFEIAVVEAGQQQIPRYDYVGLVLATRREGWRSGEIKVLLKETASEGTYSAVFVVGDKSRYGTTVTIDDGKVMEAVLPRTPGRRSRKHLIHKTYPIPEEEPETEATEEEQAPRAGSGFFVSPDIIATANHLVDDADSIVVRIGGQSLHATVKSRDRRNGLALLAVDSSGRDRLRGLTIVPVMLGDSGRILEGDRVVISGFTSPDATRPSVSEGIVNSLFGPGEDLTRFTISIAIRAGEIGGPLIDSSNRVIGIVLPADSTATGPVSVAVKSDLLSSLLKLTSVRVATIDSTSPSRDELDTSLIGQMARSAVVSIEAK